MSVAATASSSRVPYLTHTRFARKANWFWILSLGAYAVLAAGVVIEITRPNFRGLMQVSMNSVEEAGSKSAS